jgi:hypothetical protein
MASDSFGDLGMNRQRRGDKKQYSEPQGFHHRYRGKAFNAC